MSDCFRTRHFQTLAVLRLLAPLSQAQTSVPDEDIQELLTALADADLAREVVPSWGNQAGKRPGGQGVSGQWDARLASTGNNPPDILTRLKIVSSRFSLRGRWRKSRDGTQLRAFTAMVNAGPVDLQLGGLGISSGYGLLVGSPGRSGGLAAGQALPSQVTRIKGWATSAEKRSALGLGLRWRSRGWQLVGMHGRMGGTEEGNMLSAGFLQRQQGVFQLTGGVVRMADQRGVSLSGKWQRGAHRMGFEWALWGKTGQNSVRGVWLVSIKSTLMWGVILESQLAASNGSAGPLTGMRPSVLDSWGGSGWVVRLSSRPFKSWRMKFLFAHSGGKDWVGAHQNMGRQFMDLLLQGRPRPGWKVTARWHQRVRTWEAWSEAYPWLPPSLVKEDQRAGLTLELRTEQPGSTWVYSLRSLSRQGAATNGRRSLVSIRHRRMVSRRLSVLLSMQSAWGAAVDLVTAINPVRGVLLPRHWGHWSSEVLVGMEYSLGIVRIMVAASRREPAAGDNRPAENGFWVGARSRW